MPNDSSKQPGLVPVSTRSPVQRPSSIRDIVRGKLGVNDVFLPTQECALYDCSGSMGAVSKDPTRTMHDMLVDLDGELKGIRKFAFQTWCKPLAEDERIPFPGGGTNLTLALATVKREGVRHVVLITDGLPNDSKSALQEAAGLKIDIIYVGPPPEPKFLKELAQTTGGSYGFWNLSEPKKLAPVVRGLLGAPDKA